MIHELVLYKKNSFVDYIITKFPARLIDNASTIMYHQLWETTKK